MLELPLELLTQGLQTSQGVPCSWVKITTSGWKTYIISWELIWNLQQREEGSPRECEPGRVPWSLEAFPYKSSAAHSFLLKISGK